MKKVFIGSAVAIITPFDNGKIDYVSFKKLIEYQLKNKTDAIVVLGTTGEPATLTKEERIDIISFAKKQIGDKALLIVGTGANNTKSVIENNDIATQYGADALLIVTPYYNKCTQNGLIEHYKEICKHTDKKIIIYNVPGRTGVNILPETALELSKIPNICGIKEASGNISQIMKLCKILKNKMAVYSGDDSLNYVFLTLGSLGSISVTANVLPQQVKKVIDYYFKGEHQKSKDLHEKLLKINNDLFVEVNPIPVKFASSLLHLCKNELRLPLTSIEEKNKNIITEDLKEFN